MYELDGVDCTNGKFLYHYRAHSDCDDGLGAEVTKY
ncbi:hypothetical protein HCH_06971 [Hahella chejuensis KCTC 2396]|uniref:Uncharacterized protein n=1 Tax=Hahella chejuensis (strain KCTC 2396) TaxID=349521 RepID=Q2S6Y8_HAHCH|nr:hypothetical protein HCH_06971 [Hahella chejuensis KCTC 2396]